MEVLESLSCGSETIPAPVAYVLGFSNRLPSRAEWEALPEDEKYRPFYLLNPHALPADAVREATSTSMEVPEYVCSWLTGIHQDLRNGNLRGLARATAVYNKLVGLRDAVLRANGYKGHGLLAEALEYLVNTYNEYIVKHLSRRLAGTVE